MSKHTIENHNGCQNMTQAHEPNKKIDVGFTITFAERKVGM